MPYLRQTNFLGGELDSLLWGRTDLPFFRTGLRTCRNFFVSRHGSAVSRPGSTMVGTTNSGTLKLVPFVVSDSESYVLEFTDLRVRVYQSGARVTLSGGGTSGGDLVVDWASTEIAALQWAQVGDTLVVSSPARPPKEIKRTATSSPPTFSYTGISFYQAASSPWYVEVDNQANAKSVPALYNAGDNWLFTEPDADHPAREWVWWVSATVQNNTTGATVETPAERVYGYSNAAVTVFTAIPSNNNIVLAADHAVTLTMDRAPPTSSTNGSYTVIAYNYYRGRGNLAGFVGTSKTPYFVDNGSEPNYALPPLRATDPFAAYGANGYPAAVSFFQERRVWGGVAATPHTLFFSATGNYANHDAPLVSYATQPLVFELASRRHESIRAMLPLQRLLVGTDSSIWSIAGSQGPLAPDSVNAQVEDEVGIASNVPFLVANGVPLYVRAKGRGVRALALNRSGSGYDGRDISWQSQHLFLGGEAIAGAVTRQLKAWAYAEDPWGVVWAVRNDGVLLSLTLSTAGDTAWARHDTTGTYEDVCVVPEGSEDGVYVVVQRQNGRYLERMNTRVTNGNALDFGSVDSAVVFGASGGSGATTSITGLGHLEGQEVWFTAKGNVPQGPYVVTGGAITLAELPLDNAAGGVTGFTGLLYTPEIELLDIGTADAALKQKTVVSIGFEVDEARGLSTGETLDNLTEWQQHSVADGYLPPSPATTVVKQMTRDGWDTEGRAAIRQTKPLPVTVVGVVRELRIGG